MNSETINKPTTRYRHYKVAPVADLSGSFVYVGEKALEADRLSAWFGKATAMSSIDMLWTSLSGSTQEHENLPRLIVLDAPCDVRTLSNIKRLINSIQALKGITVVVNEALLSKADRKNIISARLVDDLIDLNADLAPQASRVRFMSDMKRSAQAEPATVSIEKGKRTANPAGAAFKRMFDLTCAFGLLLVFLPVMILIALAIKIESRGPIFYNSYRAGRGFRIFKFYKFRTMSVGADRMVQSMTHLNKYNTSNGALFFKVSNDLRITRVGKFLRSTGLDELPQLFNVINGDMAVVGNRPLPLYEANTLTTDEWAERFVAPAGITGLWQVREKFSSVLSSEERINTDIYYSRHHNIFMDIRIMVQTARFMLTEMTGGTTTIAIPKAVIAESKMETELVA